MQCFFIVHLLMINCSLANCRSDLLSGQFKYVEIIPMRQSVKITCCFVGTTVTESVQTCGRLVTSLPSRGRGFSIFLRGQIFLSSCPVYKFPLSHILTTSLLLFFFVFSYYNHIAGMALYSGSAGSSSLGPQSRGAFVTL